MNLWRYVGITLFLVAALGLLSTTKLLVYAGGKDKDKDKDKQVVKDKDKAADKDKDKDTSKAKDKKEEKKEEKKVEKKEEKKAEPSGEKLDFKAFDKKFYQTQTTTTKQKMTVNNQTVDQNQKQTFVIEWTPKEKKGDNYVVAQKIIGVKMDIDIGGNKISYDSSAKNPQKNPMTDFFEQLTKSDLTFTISPDLKVISVGGLDEFKKGLGDINPQMKGLLNSILSEDALKKMAEPTWYAFPKGGKIAKDQTWDETSSLDLGPIGKYKTKFDFSYKGKKDGKDIIGIKTNLEYSAPTDNKGLPFIIQEAKLKSDSGEGEAVFDPAKGRFTSTHIVMKLSGQLKIEVGNMSTTVDLTQDQIADSTTSDTNPMEASTKK